MAGCYGNSPEDRYYERMLDDYLDDTESEEEDEDGMTEAERRADAYDDWVNEQNDLRKEEDI